MDHVVRRYVDLVVDTDILLNELNEVLHLVSEQKFDMIGELMAEEFDPLLARTPV